MGWVILEILAVLAIVVLVAPVRLIGVWEAMRVEIWLSFLGLRGRIWNRDLAEPSMAKMRKATERLASEQIDPLRLIGVLRENRDTLSRTAHVTLLFLRRLWRSWRLESGHVMVALGTGDPAATGMAHGMISALAGVLASRWPQVRLESHPDFEDAAFESHGRLVFRFRLLDPAWHFLRYMVTLPWRGLARIKRQWALQHS
ncbi:MAG TPA: DUF2953 domain-containing protein [bacterium]|nr:DUF2953 domain-containing protein [bacterium]